MHLLGAKEAAEKGLIPSENGERRPSGAEALVCFQGFVARL